MTDPQAVPSPPPTVEANLTLAVLAKLGLFVVGTVMVIAAIGRAQQLLALVVMAGVLSAVVAPLVDWLGRALARPAATLVVHLVAFIVLVTVTSLVVSDIRTESEHLETYASEQLAELGDGVAPIAFSRADLSRRAADATASWGTTAVLGDDAATGIAVRASQLVVIVVLSVFFSLQGDRVIDAMVQRSSDRDRRRQLRTIWSDAVDAGARQLRHALAHGTVVGIIALVVTRSFGLPGATLLAFWAAVVSLVPVLGPVVGWMPAVVVAGLSEGWRPALTMAAVAIVTVVVSSRARAATAPPFRVGPLLAVVGIACGVNAAGLPGAATGLFLVTAGAYAAAHHWSSVAELAAERHADGAVERPPAGHRQTEPVEQTNDADRAPRVYVDISSTTLLRVGALVVFAVMFQLSLASAGAIVIWVAVGLLIAVGLDRPVSWAERRLHAPRAAIVVAGAIAVATALAGLGWASGGDLGSVGSLDDDLPQLAASLGDLPVVGGRLSELDIEGAVADFQRRAPSLIDRSPVAGQAIGFVGGGVVALFWIVATVLTALIDGPRVISAIDRRITARYTRQVRRLATSARDALAGYVAGSALVAAINGSLIGAMAALVGVPMPLMLAVWAFSWNFVPQIGAIIGWAPVLILAIVLHPIAGLGCVAFFVIYQLLENNLVQPAIVGHAVDISALAALGAALAGGAIAGLIGAVLAIPIVGVLHALRTEWSSDDFPRLRPRPAVA